MRAEWLNIFELYGIGIPELLSQNLVRLSLGKQQFICSLPSTYIYSVLRLLIFVEFAEMCFMSEVGAKKEDFSGIISSNGILKIHGHPVVGGSHVAIRIAVATMVSVVLTAAVTVLSYGLFL